MRDRAREVAHEHRLLVAHLRELLVLLVELHLELVIAPRELGRLLRVVLEPPPQTPATPLPASVSVK